MLVFRCRVLFEVAGGRFGWVGGAVGGGRLVYWTFCSGMGFRLADSRAFIITDVIPVARTCWPGFSGMGLMSNFPGRLQTQDYRSRASFALGYIARSMDLGRRLSRWRAQRAIVDEVDDQCATQPTSARDSAPHVDNFPSPTTTFVSLVAQKRWRARLTPTFPQQTLPHLPQLHQSCPQSKPPPPLGLQPISKWTRSWLRTPRWSKNPTSPKPSPTSSSSSINCSKPATPSPTPPSERRYIWRS